LLKWSKDHHFKEGSNLIKKLPVMSLYQHQPADKKTGIIHKQIGGV
jgi:hypothetical protein